MGAAGRSTGSLAGGWRRAIAIALAGSSVLCADAGAALPEDGGVRPGRNISVFHESDVVATYGHEPGTRLTVEVLRGGHRIARVAGTAFSTPDRGALEVNHGVEGRAILPGDCWPRVTPDIKPFDRIEVTDAAGFTDAILVDDIVIEKDPVELETGEVALTGHALTALGDPVDPQKLEGEFRLDDVRGGPARIDSDGAGGFTALYVPPFVLDEEVASGPEQRKGFLLDDAAEHTIGFGHLLPFETGETQIADVRPSPGPAPGCEAAVAAGVNAATATDDDFVGPATGDLRVGGTAQEAVTAVAVTLDDGPGGGEPVVATTDRIDVADGAPIGADRGWTVVFGPEDLAGFPADAQLTLAASFTGGGPATATALQIRKDMAPPAAPTASPGAGVYEEGQRVHLAAEPGARIRFTTDGTEPTPASPLYGQPVLISLDTTIRAIAIDPAGNVSEVRPLAFAIRPPAPAAAAVIPGVAPPAKPADLLVVPAPALGAPLPALRATRLSAPTRLSQRRARRNGVLAAFVTPAGAAYAEVRLYRLDGAARRLVGHRLLAAAPRRRQVANFTSSAVRRRLAAGRYVVEVRTGPAPMHLGPVVAASLRVVR